MDLKLLFCFLGKCNPSHRFDNTLIDPESDYQKKLKECNDAKDELIKIKNELAADGNSNIISNLAVTTQQALLDSLMNVLKLFEDTANNLISDAQNLLNDAVEALRAFEATFPSDLKELLFEKTAEIEKKVNELKNNYYTEFEEKYKDDIDSAKQEAKERKEKLKENNK